MEMLRVNENYGFSGMKAIWNYIELMRRRGHVLSVLEYNRILKGLVSTCNSKLDLEKLFSCFSTYALKRSNFRILPGMG